MINNRKVTVIRQPKNKTAKTIPANLIDTTLLPSKMVLLEKTAVQKVTRDLTELQKLLRKSEPDYKRMFELSSRINLILHACLNVDFEEKEEKKK